MHVLQGKKGKRKRDPDPPWPNLGPIGSHRDSDAKVQTVVYRPLFSARDFLSSTPALSQLQGPFSPEPLTFSASRNVPPLACGVHLRTALFVCRFPSEAWVIYCGERRIFGWQKEPLQPEAMKVESLYVFPGENMTNHQNEGDLSHYCH